MGIGLKASDVDWSAVSVGFIQQFFEVFGDDLFALYLFGSGNPLGAGKDYSGNDRDLIRLGTPVSEVGYETLSYGTGGYYTPFTEAELAAANHAFGVLAAVRSADGTQPLILSSTDGTTTSPSFVLYQNGASDVIAQERVDNTHTYAPGIATNATSRGDNFQFVGGAATAAAAYAYRRLPGGVGTSKATIAKAPAANPTSAQPFGIGRVPPVVGASGGFTAPADTAFLAFVRRLPADAEIDTAYAQAQAWLARAGIGIAI